MAPPPPFSTKRSKELLLKEPRLEPFQLSQLDMKGCQACFSCKKHGGRGSVDVFRKRDGMTPLYDKMEQADAMFLGTPIYFGTVSSGTKMFIERLFPYFSYKDYSSLFPRKIPVGLICTLGAGEQEEKVFRPHLHFNQMMLSMLLGRASSWSASIPFTLRITPRSSPMRWWRGSPETGAPPAPCSPRDCEKAFAMGARFAGRTAT